MVRLYATDAVRKLEDLFVQLSRSRREVTAESKAELAELDQVKDSARDTLDALFDGS
jgi:hypothetical protein